MALRISSAEPFFVDSGWVGCCPCPYLQPAACQNEQSSYDKKGRFIRGGGPGDFQYTFEEASGRQGGQPCGEEVGRGPSRPFIAYIKQTVKDRPWQRPEKEPVHEERMYPMPKPIIDKGEQSAAKT